MTKMLWNDDYLKDFAQRTISPASLIQFWELDDDDEVVFKAKNKRKFLTKFLPELGVRNLVMGNDAQDLPTSVLVFVRGNRCQEISPADLETITKKLFSFMGELGDELVGHIFTSNSLFTKTTLRTIADLYDRKPFVDTRDTAYRFFKNGWVEITKDGVSPLKAYGTIPEGYIVWNSTIIPRDYHDAEDVVVVEPPKRTGAKKNNLLANYEKLQPKKPSQRDTHYKDFITNLSRDNNDAIDEEALNRIKLAIGYLCHRYNISSNRKWVTVVDKFVRGMAKGSSNGGTGKSVLLKSLKAVMNYCELPGKEFSKSSNDKMAFSKVNSSTELIHFEDAISKTFNTQRLFTQTTGEFHIRRNRSDWVSIPCESAPKMAISSNHPLAGEGSSYTRREFVCEIGSFYRLKLEREGILPPQLHGGKHICDDAEWDKNDWVEFYRFIFECVSLYLSQEDGLPVSLGSNEYQRAKLIELVDSEELFDYFVDKLNGYADANEEVFVEQFYQEVREAFPYETRRINNQILWEWLVAVGKFVNVFPNPELHYTLDKQRLNKERWGRWVAAGMKYWKNKNGKCPELNDRVQVFEVERTKTTTPTPTKFQIPVELPSPEDTNVGIETHIK